MNRDTILRLAQEAGLLQHDTPKDGIPRFWMGIDTKTLEHFAALVLAEQVPAGWKLVPVEPTEEMIAVYLAANKAYWARMDQVPSPPIKWRAGTPKEATAASYRAMLAAAPSASHVPTDSVKHRPV